MHKKLLWILLLLLAPLPLYGDTFPNCRWAGGCYPDNGTGSGGYARLSMDWDDCHSIDSHPFGITCYADRCRRDCNASCDWNATGGYQGGLSWTDTCSDTIIFKTYNCYGACPSPSPSPTPTALPCGQLWETCVLDADCCLGQGLKCIGGGCEYPDVEPACEDYGWYWNFQNTGCYDSPQSCPLNCSPYYPLESGGCATAVDYCDYQWGCIPDFTDGGQGCCCGATPVVIDVLGNGIALTDAYNGTRFDLGGDGHFEPVAWTAANTDDAWLVLDRDGNGQVDNGKELFGNFTDQPHATTLRNGFIALAEFDRYDKGGNADDQIDKKDAVFNTLRLWQDGNKNGISEATELHTLKELGLKVIELKYKDSKKTDQFGNQFRYRAKIKDNHDAQMGRWAWDVILKVNPPPRPR